MQPIIYIGGQVFSSAFALRTKKKIGRSLLEKSGQPLLDLEADSRS